VRENDIVAKVNEFLYRTAPTTSRRSTPSRASAAIRIRITSPTAWCARATRRSSTFCRASWAIAPATTGPSMSGRATPAHRNAYKRCREWLDASIALIKPGVSTDKVCSVWPKRRSSAPGRDERIRPAVRPWLGLALHERPIISRVVSVDHPTEIKEGMVFALETYCPATDGYSAARIEEEVVVTDKGCRVITLFPAEELPIAAKY